MRWVHHRQEYVLLQPRFVLPEFFMHVRVDPLFFAADGLGMDSEAVAGNAYSSLPSLLRPLPGPSAATTPPSSLWESLLSGAVGSVYGLFDGKGGAGSPLTASPGKGAGPVLGSSQGQHTPRVAQREKQALVMAVQREVGLFQHLRQVLLRKMQQRVGTKISAGRRREAGLRQGDALET